MLIVLPNKPERFIPPIDPAYKLLLVEEHNLVIAIRAVGPVLYLDESTMQWRVLDRHISEVARARKTD